MYKTPRQCPSCASPLETRELGCPTCATTVRGRWTTGPLARLSGEQEAFLLLFVRSRGNLSDVERSLGVSYPTVRSRLDDLITALDEPSPVSRRQAILDQIARGELSVEEGLSRLKR